MALLSFDTLDGRDTVNTDSNLVIMGISKDSGGTLVLATSETSPVTEFETSSTISTVLTDVINDGSFLETTTGEHVVYVNKARIIEYVDDEWMDLDYFGTRKRVYGLSLV